MLRLSQVFKSLFLFAFFLPMLLWAKPSTNVIRVAILDNPAISAKHIWDITQYTNAYMAGIQVAVKQAKQDGLQVKSRLFTFDDDPLAVLKKIAEVKRWHPDVIIGPHNSNHMLLLKDKFKDIMVISPYASDDALGKMPKNFYTISLLDSQLLKPVAQFFKRVVAKRNLYSIVDANCKDCVDFTKLMETLYQKQQPSVSRKNVFYVNPIPHVDIKRLMRDYQPGDLINIQAVDYEASKYLTYQIVQYLQPKRPTFIQVLDQWGPPQLHLPGMEKHHYVEYQFRNTFSEKNNARYREFLKRYKRLFNSYPAARISYSTYLALDSAITALKRYPVPAKTMRGKILKSYLLALRNNPNWFKMSHYEVVKVAGRREQVIYHFNAV